MQVSSEHAQPVLSCSSAFLGTMVVLASKTRVTCDFRLPWSVAFVSTRVKIVPTFCVSELSGGAQDASAYHDRNHFSLLLENLLCCLKRHLRNGF